MYMLIIQAYTNANNPFGDHNLLDKFVWDQVRSKLDAIELLCCLISTCPFPETETRGIRFQIE